MDTGLLESKDSGVTTTDGIITRCVGLLQAHCDPKKSL